jgi:hypothetical protein
MLGRRARILDYNHIPVALFFGASPAAKSDAAVGGRQRGIGRRLAVFDFDVAPIDSIFRERPDERSTAFCLAFFLPGFLCCRSRSL